MRTSLAIWLAVALVSDAFAAAPPAVRLDAHGDPLPAGAVARMGSMRLRHLLRIGQVAISPDGSKVASLALDLRVWDSRTGRLLATFEPREEHNWGLCFSPDGKSVLSGHGTNLRDEVWVWDLATGKRRPLWGDRKYRGIIERFAFSHDGKTVAVCCSVREGGGDVTRVYLNDYPSGKDRGVLNLDDLEHIVEGMSFDPRGRLVLPSEGVHLFDVARKREIGRLGGKLGIYSFALSPDGKVAAVQVMQKEDKAQDDQATVRLVRLDTGRTTVTGIKGPLRSRFAFSDDGKELLFSSRDGPVVALDVATAKQSRVVVSGDGIWRPYAAFSAGARWLARSDFQTIEVLDLKTGKRAATFDDHRDSTPIDAVGSPDGKRIATRSKTEVRVWDRASGKMLRRIAGEGFVAGLRWSPDGKQLAVGAPLKFSWYDATTGKLVRTIPLPKADQPIQARLTSDGRRVIFSDFDDERTLPTWILDADSGKGRARLKRDKKEQLSDAGEGQLLLWQRYDEGHTTFLVRRVGEDRPIWSAQTPSDQYAQGRLFASGQVVLFGRRSVETSDALRGRRCGPAFVPKVRGPEAPKPVALSPDGRTLALIQLHEAGHFSRAAELLLCEIASGQVRARLPILPACDDAAFTADGRFLITSSEGTALVWDVDDLAARALTCREWADLAGDAPTAFAARCSLVTYPADTVALLAKKLAPSRADAKKVRNLLDGLDDESFDVRQAAERALAALGDEVEEDLQRSLASGPTQERRLRLDRLLRQLEASPERLRRMRAVEVLERIGSPESKALLKRLGAGYAGARLTREASEALARLKARLAR